ncbi:hypothetical protein CK203_036783 [Vitis vinifera]|uniref:Protein FAR1-RELATED SEQUENCE n=1 Tax=Vitis vinifera TaxID=29760 RepID=A0A438I0J9_VITVI|nr:hypothetical protein CK203_036783 [Vitis vinifera]
MTLSNSVYLQLMQSVKEKTIKREFEVKEEDIVNDDAYIGGTYHLGGNGLKEKQKVAGFSIRKDDLKRDKNGDIISRKWVCSREGQRVTKFIENDKRQHVPRSLTRVGCEAAFRVGLNRKDGKTSQAFLQGACSWRGSAEEFEKVWHQMVENLGLNENRWVIEIYGKRKRYAEAYLCGKFFAGMRSTQRAILRIWQNKAKADFESNNSSPVLSTKLSILENHAVTVYTKESFLKFREEMKNVELFFVVGLAKHLEEILNSCILKRWTKLAKRHTRSALENQTDNDMV